MEETSEALGMMEVESSTVEQQQKATGSIKMTKNRRQVGGLFDQQGKGWISCERSCREDQCGRAVRMAG